MKGRPLVLIRGPGDLATGYAVRLHRSGFWLVMTELTDPTAVRRTVVFSEDRPSPTRKCRETSPVTVSSDYFERPPPAG